MLPFDKIVLRVNIAAVLVTGFEACMSFGFVAYAIQVLGDAALANYLMATFWIALFLAELPTGYLMDLWGGRKSLVVSLVLRALAFVLFFVGEGNASIVFCANFVAGVASTFMSGAFATQVTRDCRTEGIDVDHRRLAVSALYVRSTGLILGTAAGYLIVRALGVTPLWLFSAAWAIVTAIYVGTNWSPVRADVKAPMATHYRGTWQSLRSTEGLTASTVLLSAYRTLLLPISTNSVILLVPNLDKQPLILLMFYLLSGVIGLTASRMFQHLSARILSNRLLFCALAGVSAFLIAYVPSPYNFLAFGGFLVVASITETQLRSDFYERLNSEQAGAISSVQSLLENALGALAFCFGALLIAFSSVRIMFVIFAAVLPFVLMLVEWSLHCLGSASAAVSARNGPHIGAGASSGSQSG